MVLIVACSSYLIAVRSQLKGEPTSIPLRHPRLHPSEATRFSSPDPGDGLFTIVILYALRAPFLSDRTGSMQTSIADSEQRSGKRKSTGKRKLPDQGEPSQPQSQRTISELLSKGKTAHDPLTLTSSPTSKRSRFSVSPSRSSSAHPVSPNKMYNFSGSPPKNGAAFVRTTPAPNPPPVKSQPFNIAARQGTFSPNVGAKKLVVKNLRTGPRVNHEPYFDKIWSQLDSALSDIFEGKKPSLSLEELYKGAENVCRQDRAALLAQKVQGRCKDFVAGKLRDHLVTRSGGGTDVDTLRSVIEAWSSWHSKLVSSRDIENEA